MIFLCIFIATQYPIVQQSGNPNSLSHVLADVKAAIQHTVGNTFMWIRAEIAKVTHHNNGHCYLELVEQQQHRVTAKAAAVIWSRHLIDIRRALDADYPNIVKQGVEIVFLGKVTFHELFGFQIQITAIDPTFNLGAMELRKQQTLQRLVAQGLIGLNRTISPPLVMQRVALIASPTSAGIQDFIQQVEQNKYGYKIHVTVFAASVQGESAVQSMLHAYREIDPAQFDLIAVVRGGGSKLDLEPFNSYELSATMAQCPIPVMTGIGHDVDHSVLDEIAFMMHKTPTALAAYIVDQVHDFEYGLLTTYLTVVRTTVGIVETAKSQVSELAMAMDRRAREQITTSRYDLHTHINQIAHFGRAILYQGNSKIQDTSGRLRQLVNNRLTYEEPAKLNLMSTALHQRVQSMIQQTTDRLQLIASAVALAHPQKALDRGFSISRIGGKAVRSVDDLVAGDVLHTQVSDGIIISTVTDKQKTK